MASGREEDLKNSISKYRSSASCSFGPPKDRLEGAKRWVSKISKHFPRSPEFFEAGDAVIRLLSLAVGLDRTLESRYSHLQAMTHIAPHTAAFACVLNRADKALEWLEQGRSLVWVQLSQLRTPLDDLRVRDSQLANRISEVARQLETAGSAPLTRHPSDNSETALSNRIMAEDESQAHLQLAKEWDELLSKARTLPGLDNFLSPSPLSTLLSHLPESGIIVVINVDIMRCDAFALIAGRAKPVNIPLPTLTFEKVTAHHENLSSQLQHQGLRVRGDGDDIQGSARALRPHRRKQTSDGSGLQDILRGLWVDIVKPILDALQISKFDAAPGSIQKRVWWCPTGRLSFLPIHAAGIYDDRSSESVMDYVVSSYTPTVASLVDRVKNQRFIERSKSGLLLTSQPEAPGFSDIPGTTKEVGRIHSLAIAHGTRVLKWEGRDVSVEECLASMDEFSCVHLACHASQNTAEPLKSTFHFQDGSLQLADIIRRDLKNADLAFLSACQTSAGDQSLSNESVHLAAGMLAAGYRRVVATMWAIHDQHAPAVANDFYKYLWSHQGGTSQHGGSAGFDGSQSAYALHHAIHELRTRLGDSPNSLLAWVPYVHFGY
ncbi:hypothetical protein NMY22_g8567 [Coprinellus aureogranulatus]|nr:hypothetical protein NMY22_g8567 [Coprinellus aureogranulatus]